MSSYTTFNPKTIVAIPLPPRKRSLDSALTASEKLPLAPTTRKGDQQSPSTSLPTDTTKSKERRNALDGPNILKQEEEQPTFLNGGMDALQKKEQLPDLHVLPPNTSVSSGRHERNESTEISNFVPKSSTFRVDNSNNTSCQIEDPSFGTAADGKKKKKRTRYSHPFLF